MERFDYIIIGAGSAGGVIAARLSERPQTRVLLLEAGRASHAYSRLPVSFGLLIHNRAANWLYESVPEPSTFDRPIPVPRGKLLGGSSAINGLVWVRGQPLDYDTWAQLGARGWSWQDVAPLFERIEDYDAAGASGRGRGGPLHVSQVPDENPLYDALLDAAAEAGYRRTHDYNGEDQEGIGRTQASIRDGRRMSVAHCYLRPAMRRPNLVMRTEAPVRRLRLDGRRCVGVVYERFGREVEAHADGEVILAAGAIASPQLLELSGIGNPDVMRPLGITVAHALPAVGENLRDHITARLVWRVKDKRVSYNHKARGVGAVVEAWRYATTGRGFLSLPSAPLLAFLKTRPDLASPDIQLHLIPYSIKDPKRRKLQTFPSMAVSCYQLRPESLGSVHVRSAEPDAHPAIRFNFLSDRLDQQVMVESIRIARRIVSSPAMDALRGEEHTPGAHVATDDELLDWVRRTAQTAYHPVGTCRMGQGLHTVVGPDLKVHGIVGLRVADASVFPTMPSGNTNAAAIMVGEKASDLIRAAD